MSFEKLKEKRIKTIEINGQGDICILNFKVLKNVQFKKPIIIDVPENIFIFKRDDVLSFLKYEEKYWLKREEGTKKLCWNEMMERVEQLKKWIISSVCEKDMCVGKELGLLDTKNGKVPCKEECEGCDIWIVLDRIDVVFSVSPKQDKKETENG